MRLIKELFSHLDPQRTGYLSPEAVSEYIDACGAPPSHKVCMYKYPTITQPTR
jgi:Ca2+-binding EF-hand superfamily protein